MAMRALARSLAATGLLVSACKPGPGPTPETSDAQASPQASAVPAPLVVATATVASATAVVVSPEGGPPPTPLRGDVALPADPLGRDVSVGYSLSAVLRQADVPGPLRAPEVNAAGLEAARRKTELRLAIDLVPTRMRAVFLGSGWVLPSETELRARADRYGHVVVWPGQSTYRPLAPGALRALLGERRFDVAPMTPADVLVKEEAGKRIGIRTRKVEVSTRAAKATFEVGRLVDLGEGGVLLCRMLLDLMDAPPSSAVCGDGELPVRAELRWTGHGSIGFELTGVLRKADMATTPLLVPPVSAAFAPARLPAQGLQAMLSPVELAAFRTTAVDVPLPPGAPPGSPGGLPPGPGDTLVVSNPADQLRVLHVDGIPVAWASPGARDALAGLLRGRYVVQWRSFLGETLEVPVTQTVPGVLGQALDAGAR